MTDWFAPNFRPAPTKTGLAERLWEFRRADHHTSCCELRYHGEYGVEAVFNMDGDLLIGRRFDLREFAVKWAEGERQVIENGDE